MDPITAISTCFGICGTPSKGSDRMPRWMREQATVPDTAFANDKQMHYPGSAATAGVDLDNPDDAINYVVSSICEGSDNDSIRASLKGVQAKFEGGGSGSAEASFAWKERVAEGIFKGLFTGLRKIDITNPDSDKPNFLDCTNEKLAAMCRWVVEQGPEIFAWPVEYVREHEQEIAVALACVCAVALLWELLPWVLEVLGFEAMGVRLGSAAARLMKSYMGHIPKGSWMSFFQRLGAKWGRK